MRFGFIQGVAIWEKDMVAVIFSAPQMQLNSYTVAAVVHQIRKPFCTSDDTPIFNIQVTKEKLHVLYTTVGSPCMLYM